MCERIKWRHSQLRDESVELVEHQNAPNTLRVHLLQHGVGLAAESLDHINQNQGSIGESQGSRNLTRKFHMTRRINQIDQVL